MRDSFQCQPKVNSARTPPIDPMFGRVLRRDEIGRNAETGDVGKSLGQDVRTADSRPIVGGILVTWRGTTRCSSSCAAPATVR